MRGVPKKPFALRCAHFFSRVGVRLGGNSSRPRSVKFGGKMFVVPNTTEPCYFQFVAHRAYEIEVVKHLAREIGIGGTFVDVGANCGLISFQLALLRPDLHFVCIEPNAALIPLLQANLEFCHSVKIVPKGLANSNGLTTLYVDDSRPGQSSMKFKIENGHPQLIPTVSVEDLMKEILSAKPTDIAIKVDCEGMEPEILSSLLQLDCRVPLVVFESFERARNYDFKSRVIEMMENNAYFIEPLLWEENSPYMWSAKLSANDD